jgi:N-acetylglutamate synthase-like GNAT family acetyltransferase
MLHCSIREATANDLQSLMALLTENHLSDHAILAPGASYWVAESEQGELIGAIGAEPGSDCVLLRSAVVARAWRNKGVGAALVRHLLAWATGAGHRTVYLFSTGAGPYWQRLGFHEVPVSEVVAKLPDAPQVRRYASTGALPTEIAWRCELNHWCPGRDSNPHVFKGH